MRAIGFALVLIGGMVIYLATKGKINTAFTALITGKVPSTTTTSTSSNNSNTTSSNSNNNKI